MPSLSTMDLRSCTEPLDAPRITYLELNESGIDDGNMCSQVEGIAPNASEELSALRLQ